MKQKKISTVKVLFILLVTILFNGCGVYTTVSSNKWGEYELPPSKIVKDGSTFFKGKLSDGTDFFVFYDDLVDNDGEYYYAMLMQDLGWRRNGDEWSAPQGTRSYKRGCIYVNPRRHVAVYFYPDKNFNAFKLSFTKGN